MLVNDRKSYKLLQLKWYSNFSGTCIGLWYTKYCFLSTCITCTFWWGLRTGCKNEICDKDGCKSLILEIDLHVITIQLNVEGFLRVTLRYDYEFWAPFSVIFLERDGKSGAITGFGIIMDGKFGFWWLMAMWRQYNLLWEDSCESA